MAVAAAVSHEAGARTEFHPLNGGRPLTIQGTDKGTPARRLRHIRPPVRTQDTRVRTWVRPPFTRRLPSTRAGDVAKVIKDLADLEPRGLTPLAAATNRITAKIVPMAPALMMMNQRVCVVIATDGTPTDNGFQEALGRLQALPVWVVVRLCTDEDSVIDYYNDLDAAMEAPMEVLDDLLGEAHEVCKLNRWCATARPPSRLTSDSPACCHAIPTFTRAHICASASAYTHICRRPSGPPLAPCHRLTYGQPMQNARVKVPFQTPSPQSII